MQICERSWLMGYCRKCRP